ncbi:indolepyruvate ferredoxin oxidoreductase family protein [Pseudomonas chengduensis]|uniref:Indolepyruvate ferredoxin oxidoreductase n=1 Tax=Ectopseudomonas chengduensis TaxID=489632 RepID=A0A1G6NGV2_9GAMM|nr:indolepyruvate ferredoxin oxidoreductase family protein [Pseudomonas chengduensis]MBP3061709.1 indolepyruvate ferredoxin oxidoreductase family protein [Pseudomonas chengduensis]MDH0957839.1 indolepyruvate ferredoxin oxidoreductase family protein [Pseudomonas chengduensis]MDH1535059.1 indolepyruvate ferredoxin oxidoreductase family protein [Pseudomonas chengduensis]NNB74778.1 indolepyruvate ferredoxin oxidoreductase family protein [Pseudomonas chengduensis]SDC67079.1 indolepyruvate ferredoxi
MSLAEIRLDDKYRLATGHFYLTGTQALTRLPMLQKQRDAAFGLNTACFISGYRGSPLGGLDKSLWDAREYLKENHIHFQPGVNEELGATAVWGSQQANLFPGARYDGVFAMWYGKGPGVDRSGDVFKHGNSAGVSKHGGVLLLAGDDHGCKSSTIAHQSEHAFIAASIPVLNPANVQEVLDYGIIGWELSRYSGCWVALKTIAENVDSSAVVDVDPLRIQIKIPEDFQLPEDGVHIRWPDPPLAQEKRLNVYKIYAARAFALANNLNQVKLDSPNPRLGIITTGKSYLDVRQALDDLGLDEALCAKVGLRVLKVGMSWPLEPVSVHQFAEGLDEILVVEEKRSIIEDQLTGQLYNWPVGKRPRVVGEFDEQGNSLLPNLGELTPAMIARVIAKRLAPIYSSPTIEERLAFLDAKEKALAAPKHKTVRTPHFCSGCPHNSSTKVPEGSRALAGIGCHYMTQWMDRSTDTFTQMGGEGATWIGQAPFTDTPHVFQNLGDGTYFHSGHLALRAAVAAGVNITYKILYNDAVAMTGGQPIDGELRIDQLSQQVHAEGVKRIALVSDEPDKYPTRATFAPGVTFHHRRELDAVQRELREVKGVSVILYDQTCATEKRRRRKRGKMVDPAKRAFINPAVCEGCGDCSVKSNCLSVLPLETELGRKREIDQSACNKDFSCLEGFCPSFVTVHGGSLRKPEAVGLGALFIALPEPKQPALTRPWNILLPGVGGSGVTTVGALLGMAAHIEGKGCTVLDQAGLAQKFGPVITHIRIATRQSDIYAVRIAAGETDLLLGCDLVVSSSEEALAKLNYKIAHAVINSHEAATAEFTRNPDAQVPGAAMREAISEAVGEGKTRFVDATRLATRLLGDSIATNLFMLGYAYQLGLVPVSAEALNKAIELNGVSVQLNQQAFLWGRRAAHDLAAVEKLAAPKVVEAPHCSTLEEIVADRVQRLTAYQNAAYAERYRELVEHVRKADTDAQQRLSKAVARYYFKLLAYKDEYEVARLYSDATFRKQLEAQFEGDYQLQFHLAPSWLSKPDAVTGEPCKRSFGPWMLKAFGVLARFKFLRGSVLDPFGHSAERRLERELIEEYEANVAYLLAELNAGNYRTAVALAEIPEQIRGYGHVKEAALTKAREQATQLKARLTVSEIAAVQLFEPAA